MQLENTEAAYFAGLFDGEGSTFIYHRKTQPYAGCLTKPWIVFVRITNTNKEVIDRLRKAFGGNVYKHLPRANRKQAWSWQASNQIGYAFLRVVLPYLIIKRVESLICLKMADAIDAYRKSGMNGGRRVPESELEKRIAIHSEWLQSRKVG